MQKEFKSIKQAPRGKEPLVLFRETVDGTFFIGLGIYKNDLVPPWNPFGMGATEGWVCEERGRALGTPTHWIRLKMDIGEARKVVKEFYQDSDYTVEMLADKFVSYL